MNIKRTISLGLSLLLLLMTFSLPVNATKGNTGSYEKKDEVIYAKLDQKGKLKNMYVVNSFQIKKQGYITDYGNYSEIRNLTNLEEITKNQERNTFLADGDDFYYQGELEGKDLPWKIDIIYLLDGVEMPVEELAGKSGRLEIQIHMDKNEKIDPVFFENYLLQIMLTFDPLLYEDIQAPKGTEANEGKNKLISFSVMPGQAETVILTAKVKNLELEPIEISAIPANLALDDFDTDDMQEDIEALSDAIAQIHEGVTELKKGTKELADGTGELKEGSGEFSRGMEQLNNSSGQLIDGSQQILQVLTTIDSSLDQLPEMPEFDLEQIEELPGILQEIARNLLNFAEGLEDFMKAIEEIESIEIPEEQIDQIIQAMEDAGIQAEVIDNLITMYELAKEVADTIGDYPEELQIFLKEMAKSLQRSAKELEENLDLLEDLDQLEDLQTGFSRLTDEYRGFHNGLTSYTAGVNTLTKEYKQIDQGLTEISKGNKELAKGVKDLNKGTGELHEQTKNLPDELKSEIEKMLDDFDFSNFKPSSFASEKNTKIGVVQFVLRTEKIEIPEDDDQTKEEDGKKSLWQRFLDLFRRKK